MATQSPEQVFNLAKAQGQAQASAVDTKIQISRMLDQINAISEDQTGSITGAASADQQISSIKNQFALNSDSRKAAVVADGNTDPLVAGNRITKYLSEMNENADRASQAADIVYAKKSATIFNDPIGFISAQFSLPSDIETYNYYAGKHNAAEENLKGLLQATTAAGVTINTMAQTTSAALAAAENDKIAQTARFNVDKIKIDNLQTNMKGAEILNSITGQQLSQIIQGEQLKISQAHLALSAQQLQETIKQRGIQNQMRQDALDAKKETTDERALYTLQYNMAAKAKGLAELPEAAVIAGLKQRNKNITDLVNYGQNIQANGNSTTGVPIAGSAGEAALLLATSNARPVGSSAPVTRFLKDTYDQFRSQPAFAAIKDPAAVAGKVDELAKLKAIELQRSIKYGDPDNFYSAAPTSTVLATSAIRQIKSPFIENILVPANAAAPTIDIKPEDILGMAVAQLNTDPKQLENTAKGIVAYYTQATRSNNLTRGITEAGLPKQIGYNAQMPLGVFGNNITVDLTSTLAVKRYLISNTSRIAPFTKRIGD